MTKPRSAIVTGAYGFIGSHVATHLEGQGVRVLRVGRGDTLLEEFVPDVVFHCAGPGTVGEVAANPHADFQSSVVETEALFDQLGRQAPQAKIVICSSAAVYGNEAAKTLKETYQPAPMSAYGTHKLLNELLLKQRCRQLGLSGSIVRLFSVYGNGMRKQILWDGCKKLIAGDLEFHGTGDEVRDFFHIDDVVSLLLLAADNAAENCPIVNGGTGQASTVREILVEIAKNLDCPGGPIFTGRTRPDDPTRLCADVSQLGEWGFEAAVSWRKGVADYCTWFIEVNR